MQLTPALAFGAIVLLIAPSWGAEPPPPPFEPRYEIGIAGGMGQMPDYPGSNQYRLRALALPYLMYRGSTFRADDREGTRARLLKNDFFDLDLSMAGSFPANSDDNEARRGMPDLDWLGEIGPRAEITLSRLEGAGRLRILIPARAVFSTNFTSSHHHRGFNISPGLALDLYNQPFDSWKTSFKIQSVFVDEELARYFYEVEPHFATPTRGAYRAQNGYLESDVMMSLVVPVKPKVRLFSVAWASSLSGATNRASPLVTSSWNYSWALGVTWIFHHSQEAGDP